MFLFLVEVSKKICDYKFKALRKDHTFNFLCLFLFLVKKLEKEVETVNHLNEKKLATMKSINENNHKLEAEKLEL